MGMFPTPRDVDVKDKSLILMSASTTTESTGGDAVVTLREGILSQTDQ